MKSQDIGRYEWLEADGLGGFASGTVSGIRTRRYHALLLPALTPPTGRIVLVNGFDAWIETPAGQFALSAHLYAPGIVHPDGESRIESFEPHPWPRWTYRLEDGTGIEQEILAEHGAPVVALSWRLLRPNKSVRLSVRPLLSGRDYHSLHRENPDFCFDFGVSGDRVKWTPYHGLPAVVVLSNGRYVHNPDWYRSYQYEEELARGLDFIEDLASPGEFLWELNQGEAVWILASEGHEAARPPRARAERYLAGLRTSEAKRRRRFSTASHRAADAYIVRRGKGKSIVGGYPWFTDWGRDTFIAMRGLCLATGRLDEARDVLHPWAESISEGMLPNRFPDWGETPEYNSVDASLWFVVAVEELFVMMERQAGGAGSWRRSKTRRELAGAVQAVLTGYLNGTRNGIRCDQDGLLAAGEPGVQLTWMDAKVGDWVVTPRIGKPVEVEALWLNALRFGATLSKEWASLYQRGLVSFDSRFWNESGGYLYDVVDVDHHPGTADATLRPNQIFAVGGLPLVLLDKTKARSVVDVVEADLLTPAGLRSLAPNQTGYVPQYRGGVWERDRAYHQGTVWPWLIGAFIEAWVRVRGNTARARTEARNRFLRPMVEHLDPLGMGHWPEIADAESPHRTRGCPFQAWSVGERLRTEIRVVARPKGSSLRPGRRQTARGGKHRPQDKR